MKITGETNQLNAAKLAGAGVVYYRALVSTNTTARRLAEKGAANGTAVAAEEQRRGRGRHGRAWASAPGKGLYFSLILRPRVLKAAAAAPVTLAAGASLATTLRQETGLPVKIKWPNDLLLYGRKIGGILSELKNGPESVDYLVIGVGLNINHDTADFTPELRAKASSLKAASGRSFERTALLLASLDKLREDCRLFFEAGFAPFRQLWLDLNETLGKSVTVTSWSGETIRGRALDLDQNGALLIEEHPGAVREVCFGEVQ
ncbi:MAG: biotin--[acetyl-CoA-carboxylase] ligase [Bacillota bacterium]